MIRDFLEKHLFIISALICGFCISVEYGVTRPAVNSLFLAAYSAKLMPYAWICAVPLNFLIVYLYNRFLPKLGCIKMLTIVALSVITINSFSALFLNKIPYLTFFQAIWKDVYILLMYKQLWSLVHTTIDAKKAKYLYGFLFGIGGLGAVCGGLLASLLATEIGSQRLLFLTIPCYLAILVSYFAAFRNSNIRNVVPQSEKAPQNPFTLIKNSSLLILVLSLVVLMQVSTSLVDYQFNLMLEKHIPDVDLRTKFAGHLHSIINAISIGVGGFLVGILVNFLGLKKSHLLIPLTLGVNALLLLITPTFPMVAYTQVYIKATDYSFFSSIKEMLYVPMNFAEKFQAKAVIDVFAYRSARALASFLVLFCQSFLLVDPFFLVGGISLTIFVLWLFTVVFMFKHYEARTLSPKDTSLP